MFTGSIIALIVANGLPFTITSELKYPTHDECVQRVTHAASVLIPQMERTLGEIEVTVLCRAS